MRQTGWIGMFDSGVGGLTVARELFRQLPGYPVVYLADSAHVPYGDRSPAELLALGDAIVRYLQGAGAQQIVFACNTSSAVSLPTLRERYSGIPMVGMIDPGARAAIRATQNGRIGLLATQATVKSGAYEKAVHGYNPEAVVVSQAAPALVPLVEAGRLHDQETRQALAGYLEPLLAAGIDTLVLGCTHYPFLVPLIRELVGPEVRIVDPASAVIGTLKGSLAQADVHGNGRPNGKPIGRPNGRPPRTGQGGVQAVAPQLRLLTTGDPARFAAAVERFLPAEVARSAIPAVEKIDLDLDLDLAAESFQGGNPGAGHARA